MKFILAQLNNINCFFKMNVMKVLYYKAKYYGINFKFIFIH